MVFFSSESEISPVIDPQVFIASPVSVEVIGQARPDLIVLPSRDLS